MTNAPIETFFPFYVSTLEKNGLTSGTINNYLSCLRHLETANIDEPLELCAKMDEFIEFYSNDRNSALTKFSAYINFLKIYGLIQYTPLLKQRRQNMRKIAKKWLEKSQVDVFANSMNAVSDTLITLLMFECCARVSEILALKRSDFDPENRQVIIVSTKTMNKVSNQNLARRTMTLSKGTSEMLKLYSQGHRQLDKLFKTKYWPFWHRFKLTSQKVFGHPYTTPHFMRASSAVFLISKGLDLNTVAELGGWNSLNSMKLYLKESGVTSANVMNRLNLDWEATKQPEQKMLVEALS